MHKPIQLQGLGLAFPHKLCFEHFDTYVLPGSRIAIIGNNGNGKSSLLKILANVLAPTEGRIIRPPADQLAYVPQHLDGQLSGGERFWCAFNAALSRAPDVLLLDEPTNHLDKRHRQSLLRALHHFDGTLFIASHDVALLRYSVTTFWHMEQQRIHVFQGHYEDYVQACESQRLSLTHKKNDLQQQNKALHQSLMQEQQRAAKRRAKGEKNIANRKWATIRSVAKAGRANTTAVTLQSALNHKKQVLTDQLHQLYLPEVITPRFSLKTNPIKQRCLIAIEDGSVAYVSEKPIVSHMYLTVNGEDRVAICGDNGSGKSTLLKAILADESVITSGSWFRPALQNIGYLDQHYAGLVASDSVLASIQKMVPSWSMLDIRRHLTDFLFFNNDQVQAPVATLSGGEKARLCLAKMAAATPALLILDEVTNNLDLASRAHVIQVLRAYPGALLVISHDEDFLADIGICDYYYLAQGRGTALFPP